MRDEEPIEQLRESLRRQSPKDLQDIWEELIRRGIIDAEGNVLVRMPEPPAHLRPDKKKRKKKGPSAPRDGAGSSLPES